MSTALAIRLSKRFDQFEQELANSPQPKLKLKIFHRFTSGMYIRECVIPAGTLCTSKIHRTEHPFVIAKGLCSVWSGVDGEKPQMLGAPYTGITKPGTRRIIYAHEDVLWITFHVTKSRDVAAIERRIIFKHDQHLPFGVCAVTGDLLLKEMFKQEAIHK